MMDLLPIESRFPERAVLVSRIEVTVGRVGLLTSEGRPGRNQEAVDETIRCSWGIVRPLTTR
jgi:hypothetical protein